MFSVNFPDSEFEFNLRNNSVKITVGGDTIFNNKGWEVERIDDGKYHIRRKNWMRFFWLVDINKKTLSITKGAEQNFPYTNAEVAIKRTQNGERPVAITIKADVLLTMNLNGRIDIANSPILVAPGDLLAVDEKWEVAKHRPGVFRMKLGHWNDFFWEVDTHNAMIYRVSGMDLNGSDSYRKPLFADIWVDRPAPAKAEGAVVVEETQWEAIVSTLHDAILNFDPKIGKARFLVGESFISDEKTWDIASIGLKTYHLRHRNWKEGFWELDLDKEVLYEVAGDGFGRRADTGEKRPVEYAFIRKIKSGSEITMPGSIEITFLLPQIWYYPSTGAVILKLAGRVVSEDGDWHVKKVSDDVYHIKHKDWKGFHFETNMPMMNRRGKVLFKSYNSADQKGGSYSSMAPGVVSVFYDPMKRVKPKIQRAASAKPRLSIGEDLGFKKSYYTAVYRKSKWYEKEKAAFSKVLEKRTFDVLVVPVQVQGHAFDRPNRAIMTRTLAERIKEKSGLSVPDITLVSRALGYMMRRFDDKEVIELADKLKVRYIVRTYTGHNLDEKLFMTITVQERGEDGRFKPKEKINIQIQEFKDIEFSDAVPPAEAAQEAIEKAASKFSFSKNMKAVAIKYGRNKNIATDVKEVFGENPRTLVLGAYYLQLVGVMYPEDSKGRWQDDYTAREHLFERSLTALMKVSPRSPDYRLLKARAYFYLHSRPAALESLGRPETPAEKAFAAYLDGNLPELKKWTVKIKSPLHRLISEVELNDLRYEYDPNYKIDGEYLRTLAERHPGWEWFIARRLQGKYLWYNMPNFNVKKMLDSTFPIEGYTAEGLAGSSLLLSPDTAEAKVDLSVYEHYGKVLGSSAVEFASADGSDKLVTLDALDLIYAIGEANLWRKFRLNYNLRDLKDLGKDLLDSYEKVYSGNLMFTYHKVINLGGSEGVKLRDDLCCWSQGQLEISRCSSSMELKDLYNTDYPQRVSDDESVQRWEKGLKHNLLYTHNNFDHLFVYYKQLLNYDMQKQAEALLKNNRHRFVGDRRRSTKFAEMMEERGDMVAAERYYKEAVSILPGNCDMRLNLSRFYLKGGDLDRAFVTLDEYPGFETLDGDMVAISNCAYEAGYEFWARGELDKAMRLFKVSAKADTGAAADMLSVGYLALYNGNYREATEQFIASAKRYKSNTSYTYLLSLLHAQGYSTEAWSIFHSLNMKARAFPLLSAMVSSRLEGKGDEEQLKILTGSGPYATTEFHAVIYAIYSLYIDRPAVEANLNLLKDLRKHYVGRGGAKVGDLRVDRLLSFCELYGHLRNKEYGKAFKVFREMDSRYFIPVYKRDTASVAYMLPYFTWASVKAGDTAKVESYLRDIKDMGQVGFNIRIALAMLSGGKGDHEAAVGHLRSAIEDCDNPFSFPLFNWYKLVEMSEWLYEDTGREEYKALAMDLAKKHQKMLPFLSWAYAVEAKYTKNKSDRLRALAITLYLDRRSERISGFSEAEKRQAMDWLKKNNPFRKDGAGGSGGVQGL